MTLLHELTSALSVDTNTLLDRFGLLDCRIATGDDTDARRQLTLGETWPQLPQRRAHQYPDEREFMEMRRYLCRKITARVGDDAAIKFDDELRIRHGWWKDDAGERWIADLRREADRD